MKPEFEVALEEVITSIASRADEENRKTDAWKDLFSASEKGLQGLLSEAERQTNSVIMKLTDVIKQRFGIKRCSHRLYNLLKALPFAMWEVRQTIDNEQGMSCCADKARKVYYEEVLAEINKIKASE